jgi:thiamine biosynthesis lipoprotein
MAAGPERQRFWLLLAALLIAAVGVAWWSARRVEAGPVVVRREPQGVMGTRCVLVAVLSGEDARRGAEILQSAEDELRRLEAVFSTWIGASEISGFNRAPAGEEVLLSDASVEVLRRAQALYAATSGAFDITAGPLIEGWRRAAQGGRLPDREELDALRVSSSWEDLEITKRGAVKSRATVRIDIDGVAKGYAIDRALSALRRAGAIGGMVEVGGDLRVFGRSPAATSWPVGVLDPFADRLAGSIDVADRAVCTSGNYARFVEIGGRRYSHIIDPRSGMPAEDVASATVVAADAASADAWATALSVLGVAGLEVLPQGVEALLLVGDAGEPRGVATPGFPTLVEPAGLRIRRLD